MKILWINSEASFTGGAETYIHQTASLLNQQHNTDNVLLYSHNSRVDPEFIKEFSFASVIADLKLQIKALNPDIIYVHQVHTNQILDELAQLNTPVVAFIHDHKNFCLREHKYKTISQNTCTSTIGLNCYTCLGFLNKSNSFPYITINTVSNVKKTQQSYKSFDLCILASEYMKNHLIEHGFRDDKLLTIPLFSQNQSIPAKKKIDTDEKRFLFVGQLINGKGLDILLNAFSIVYTKTKNENLYLDICGDGNQKEKLIFLANKLGIEKKVVFHGKISHQLLDEKYVASYAVVVPSRAPETFNLVGLEAMKNSKAVIASNVGGIKEWLKDGVTGLSIKSNDKTDLANAIFHAFSNPNEIEVMGKNAYDSYMNNFKSITHCDTLYSAFSKFTKGELL